MEKTSIFRYPSMKLLIEPEAQPRQGTRPSPYDLISSDPFLGPTEIDFEAKTPSPIPKIRMFHQKKPSQNHFLKVSFASKKKALKSISPPPKKCSPVSPSKKQNRSSAASSPRLPEQIQGRQLIHSRSSTKSSFTVPSIQKMF